MNKDSFDNFEHTDSLQDCNISQFDKISGIDIDELNK